MIFCAIYDGKDAVVTKYGTFTPDLEAMCGHILSQGVDTREGSPPLLHSNTEKPSKLQPRIISLTASKKTPEQIIFRTFANSIMKDFAAIDFETANHELTSACAVGLVVVRDGEITKRFYSLIQPEPNYYEWFNTKVNGLRRQDTDGAPLFPQVWQQVTSLLELNDTDAALLGMSRLPLVAHNKMFDERVLKACLRCYQIDHPDYQFFCTLQKSRKIWKSGRHTLDVIADYCGYDLKAHHHALADAEACAAIAIQIL